MSLSSSILLGLRISLRLCPSSLWLSQPSDLWEHLPSLPGDVWSSGLATSHLSSSHGPCPHPRGLQSPDWGEAAKGEGREKGSRPPRVTQLGGGEARECRGAQTGPAAEEPELDGGARSVLRAWGQAGGFPHNPTRPFLCRPFSPGACSRLGPLHLLFPPPGMPFPQIPIQWDVTPPAPGSPP